MKIYAMGIINMHEKRNVRSMKIFLICIHTIYACFSFDSSVSLVFVR